MHKIRHDAPLRTCSGLSAVIIEAFMRTLGTSNNMEEGAKYRKGTKLSVGSDGAFTDTITPLCHEGFSSGDCPVPSMSILCVEDDHFQQEALIGLFALANTEEELYKVKVVGSAAEAFAALEEGFKPNLVLLDVILGGEAENWDELLPKLRAFFDEKEPPTIVFASVLSHVERVNNLCALGVHGYLVKPIAPSTIKLIWQFCYPVAQKPQCSPSQPLTPRSARKAISPPVVAVVRDPANPAYGWAADSRATTPSPRCSTPRSANGQPSGSGLHSQASSAGDGYVYSRLRHENPAGRLRPIHLRPVDEVEEGVGGCKQQ